MEIGKHGQRDPRRADGRSVAPRQRAKDALRQGRLQETLDWIEKARRAPLDEDPSQIALEESEALLGLACYGKALAVATRALRRRPQNRDRKARLRIVRALALWEAGRVALARNELRRAASEATEPATHARLEETRARLAWQERRVEEARAGLQRARALHEELGYRAGVVRALETEGALLCDTGPISEALAVHTRRIELARAMPRLDTLARAWADRGALLLTMGRWNEALAELDRAADCFHALRDPREHTLVGCARAVADLAMGDLVAARRRVERAYEQDAREGGSPRAMAEDLLLLSDVHLAAGQPQAAEAACGRALQLFALVRDRVGKCRARIRRSQASLEQGRVADALREARLAAALVPVERSHVRACAQLALGRVLLRCAPGEASSAFEKARALAVDRPGLADMATIGTLLACKAAPDEQALRDAIARLEAWGDRQMLSLCLSDIRELAGLAPAGAGFEVRGLDPCALATDSGPGLIDVAVALANGAGWVAALQALRRSLPWQRVVWFSETAAWELRFGEEAPQPLSAQDLAADLRPRVHGPALVHLTGAGPYRSHPTCVRHDLEYAVLAPLEHSGALYLDFRRGADVSETKAPALLAQLTRLLEAHRAGPVAAPVEPPCRLAGMIGESPAMREVFQWVRRVAAWEVPVHIFGETGTGKELVARGLHQQSQRACGPFVAVNASSLSEELFESQMFGHARGAFTSAVCSADGFVAQADKGTLFIDEVADLSARVQAKLLRFVQEGEYGRLGETTARRADVRIVTATNVDLKSRVAAGAFREDLMYRLFDWTIALPPLRERGDDVLLLGRHFIGEFASRHGRTAPALSREAARALQQYAWPGNVRQLRAEIARMVVRAEGAWLRSEHVSAELRVTAGGPCSALREARLAFEREHIAHVLLDHRGNRARAAAALGISRQGLHDKIHRVGLA